MASPSPSLPIALTPPSRYALSRMYPNDFGPIYTETLPGLAAGLLPVEPWNTWSNLVFVLLFVHIAFRTRLDYQRYPLIVISLPILAIGIIGGTIYHATRSHVVWLFMDFMPILILTSAAALAFWREVIGTWSRAVLFFLLVAVSGRALGFALATERSVQISLGYLSAALSILLPLAILVRRVKWRGLGLLCGIALTFSAAVACRMLDRAGTPSPFPMGTHFLWHVFGGASVWMLMLLVIRLNDTSEGNGLTQS
jgi:hypothetical protein